MKNILVNAFLEKNLGDDLFLKILFDRYPNVKWYIDTSNKEYEEIYKSYNNVDIIGGIIYRICKKLKIEKIFLNKCDSLVFIGGSIFIQYDGSENLYEERKRQFLIFEKKPKFILGSNFGPYYDENFKVKNELLFNESTDVCFRDKYSYNLFKTLNNVRVAPDIVFQLKPKNIKKIKNSIGISIIDLDSRDELKKYKNIYINKIKEIVEQSIFNNKSITFFSFCEAQGDIKAINEVLNLIDSKCLENIRIVNYIGNIEVFLEKFEEMECIIGTRFHACILSQVFNQGLYPIVYSNKTYNVLKDIELDEQFMYIKDLEDLDVINVLKLINNNKIKDKNIFKDAEKQFEILDNYIRNN